MNFTQKNNRETEKLSGRWRWSDFKASQPIIIYQNALATIKRPKSISIKVAHANKRLTRKNTF